MNEKQVQEAARHLAQAHRDRRALEALPPDCAPRSEADAYRIQDTLVALMDGSSLGWKVGCTSKESQDAFGVDAPIAGRLVSSLAYKSPVSLSASQFFMYPIESEIGFRLDRDLPASGAPYERDDVVQAAGAVHPAVEIADSRYVDFRNVGALSVIADNSNHGAVIYGPPIKGWRTMELEAHSASLIVNGARVAKGSGAEVMGDPVASLLWLVNNAAARGHDLREGELIITGTWTAVHFANAGDAIRADFGQLGRIELRLENEAS